MSGDKPDVIPNPITKQQPAPRDVKDKAEANGGLEGPDSMYVKLISSDKHEFIIKREHAMLSPTIGAMLDGPGMYQEKDECIVTFREIPSHALHKVCQYLAYKAQYSNCTTEIPTFPIAPEVAFEVLMAANFLSC